MIDRRNERKRDWQVSGGLPLSGSEWEVIRVEVNSDTELAQHSACLALFFPFSHLPSMDEPPSPLLKSRIPRKTVIFERNRSELFVYVSKFEHHRSPCRFTNDQEFRIKDLHCPLRKGIIYYRWDDVIFEHNIHSSGRHEVDSHAAH